MVSINSTTQKKESRPYRERWCWAPKQIGPSTTFSFRTSTRTPNVPTLFYSINTFILYPLQNPHSHYSFLFNFCASLNVGRKTDSYLIKWWRVLNIMHHHKLWTPPLVRLWDFLWGLRFSCLSFSAWVVFFLAAIIGTKYEPCDVDL